MTAIIGNTFFIGEKMYTKDMVSQYLVNVLGYSNDEAEDELRNGTEWALSTMSEEQREECFNYNQ